MNPALDTQKNRSKILLFIGLSVALHFLVMISAYWMPLTPIIKTPEAVFVDLNSLPPLSPVSPKEQEKIRQVVESEKTENQTLPKDAKYLGERNQTAEEDTKAKTVDSFRSGADTFRPAGKGLSLKDLAPVKEIAPPSQKEIDGFEKERKQVAQQDVGDGKPKSEETIGAANNDYLKNVKDGNRTMLSTKEFIYFGYYHRVRQKLEVAWNSRLRATLSSAMSTLGGRQLASDHDYVTKVVVILDSAGKVTGVKILQGSGARDLDQAAVDAFNMAGPFPDPPSGIADENGEIKIPWDFILQS